jgi:hypothetical protein
MPTKMLRSGDDLLLPAEKRRKVLDMKRKGSHYEEIADQVGYTPAYCRKIVAEALKELAIQCTETAAEIRQLEEERLDTMYKALEEKIAAGILGAIEAGLKIMGRRAALRGLDQPATLRLTFDKHTDAELLQLAQERGMPIPPELLENPKSVEIEYVRPNQSGQPLLQPGAEPSPE